MNIHEWSSRSSCVACDKGSFEEVFSFENFPAFLGCVDTPESADVRGHLQFDICTNCGCVQARELAPLALLYGEPHADAPGVIWDNHVKEYAAFILKYGGEKIFEVGGGNGKLADEVLGRSRDIKRWEILEPNTQRSDYTDPRLHYVEGWFTPEFRTSQPADTFVFSHVVEHFYEPQTALKTVATNLPPGGRLLISFPDMRKTIEEGSLNVLHFEHSYYADEPLLDYLVGTCGFKKIDSYHYAGHSIFFAFERDDSVAPANPARVKDNRELLGNYMSKVFADAAETADRASKLSCPIYLCPASIFAQFFLRAGFDERKLRGLIDNSPLKIGKRLYGTKLVGQSPSVLKTHEEVAVIMRAGVYDAEIKKQISETIRPDVIFL